MASPAYQFGDFRLDPANRELSRGGDEVSLPPKAFECIVYLVEHRDRAIGRDELIEAVWGHDNLSDSLVGQTILMARRALDDTGEEQHVIKTVRGFGYRWVAPVEVVEPPLEAGLRLRRMPPWLGWAALIATLAGGAVFYLWRGSGADKGLDLPALDVDEADIVLVLPVGVDGEADGRNAWMRLGLMDLIAERLRAAGQPVVPSETAIALGRGLGDSPGPEGMERLTGTTGARLVLGTRAHWAGERWSVSIRSLDRDVSPLTATGEAADALEAARVAADRMALSLGLTPAPEPGTDPGLSLLLQQAEAAMLAQQMDLARELIEASDPALRQRPEVRHQLARIDAYSGHYDVAQAGFETLLDEPLLGRDADLRARVLHGLAAMYLYRGDHGTAEPLLEEAMRLRAAGYELSTLGQLRNVLGAMAMQRGDIDAARTHLAQARVALEATGDVLGLSLLENVLGALETQLEDYASALSHIDRSARHAAALHDLGSELSERANAIYLHLELLDPESAAAIEPRLMELYAQVTNPYVVAWADLARAHLLATRGHLEAADALLDELLRTTGERDSRMGSVRMVVLALLADRAARRAEPAVAAQLAAEAVEHPAAGVSSAETRGRAWLTLIRAQLDLGRSAAAAEAAAVLADWAERGDALSSKIYAALAQAEVAAADGRDELAETSFERALALAAGSRLPRCLLQVAEGYVPWLLAGGDRRAPRPERALVVASRVAEYADRHYDAALLRLRVYHAASPPSAWRKALERASSLAGERQLPPELLSPPPVERFLTDS